MELLPTRLAIQNPDDSLISANIIPYEQELQRIEERSPIFNEMEDLRERLNRYEENINSLNDFLDNFRGADTPITDPNALSFLEEVNQNGSQYGQDMLSHYFNEIRVKEDLSREIVERLDVLRRQVYPDGEIPFNAIDLEMQPSLNLFRAARTARLAREAAQRARDAARLGRADNTYYYF